MVKPLTATPATSLLVCLADAVLRRGVNAIVLTSPFLEDFLQAIFLEAVLSYQERHGLNQQKPAEKRDEHRQIVHCENK